VPTPEILATWEAEIWRIKVWGPPRQIVQETPISKITRAKWARGVAQAVEFLLYKCKGLSSNTSPTKKNHLGFFFSFLYGTGIWTQGLMLARQVLYTWVMSPALFALGVFWFVIVLNRVLCFCPGCQPGPPSTYLHLPYNWNYKHASPFSAYLLDESLTNFLPKLVSNSDPSNLHLLRSWDYKLYHHSQRAWVFFSLIFWRSSLFKKQIKTSWLWGVVTKEQFIALH
jgi:hypothetical protein